MNRNYNQALALIEHYKALEMTEVYVDSIPLSEVTKVEVGSSYRLSMPVSLWLSAEHEGIKFRTSYELEGRGANGTGTNQFHTSILSLSQGLANEPRKELISIIEGAILPEMRSRTLQIHQSWAIQAKSRALVEQLVQDLKA